MAIVYLHRRNDNNSVFYVGIGKTDKRAYSKLGRNKYWRNIISAKDYTVEITHKDIIWEEACSIEKYLISFYGRIDLGLGTLVNMTDGGDGINNLVFTDEIRKNKSNSKKGDKNPMYGVKYSAEYKKNMSEIMKRIKSTPENKAKVSAFHKGKKLTEEHKRKIGISNSRKNILI